jgi:hypothetical protein
MASVLKVDKLDPQSGTALEIGTSGDTVTVPTGAGLTVVDEVKTNKISPSSGVAFTLGDSGDTFTVPSGATIVNSGTATGFGGGKIGQVISTSKTDTTSTASASFVDITGMTLDITPAASGSKILILVQTYICGGATANQPINLLRDSTIIGVADDTVDYTMPFRQPGDAQNQYRFFNLDTIFLDSPATTSATTYKLQWKTNSGTLYLNRTVNEGGLGTGVNACSTITAMEVLA